MSNSVAIVTGAAGDIGQAVVSSLTKQGHRVAGFDLVPKADVGALDVRSFADVEAVVADVEDRLGPIDVVVNGAGVLAHGPAIEITADQWQSVFDVNTAGVFAVSTAVARRMVPRQKGAIITIASNAGRVPRHSMAAYSASKAAAAIFTQSLGLELGQYGIRCNVVSPGTTRTAMTSGILANQTAEQSILAGNLATFKAGIALGRIADPGDIAEAVAWLASDAARQVTMHDLVVDGGASQSR